MISPPPSRSAGAASQPRPTLVLHRRALMGALLATGLGGALSACGVRLDDFGPEPVPRPDASERARDAVAVELDRLRGTAAALAASSSGHAEAAVPLSGAAQQLLESLGGVYANTSSTVTPTPEPYTPPAGDEGSLLDGIDDCLVNAYERAAEGLDAVVPSLRPALAQAAAGADVAGAWWSREAERDRMVLDSLEESAEQERISLLSAPAPSTSAPRAGGPEETIAELLEYCFAAEYLAGRIAVHASDDEQEVARGLQADLDRWTETLRTRLERSAVEAPEPAPAYTASDPQDAPAEQLGALVDGLAARTAAVLAGDAGLLAGPASWLQSLGGHRLALDGALSVLILEGEQSG